MGDSTTRIFRTAFFAGLIALMGFYFFLDPEKQFFPRCPFLWLTGYKCPGCGAQRAVHALLHGRLLDAWKVNFLFVLGLPYVSFGLLLEYTSWGKKQTYLRKTWYGLWAARLALLILLGFGIGRNIWNW